MENVASIGDDLNDNIMLQASKRSYVPNNASLHIKKNADVILTSNGGDGAVREMIEELIVSEGLERDYLALWS
jgi:3-deoxy-D-manno-octulosonate 8-phosphate phosphatase (KDO 8-P phosphatase)